MKNEIFLRFKVLSILLSLGLLTILIPASVLAVEATTSAETSVSANIEIGDVVTLETNEVVQDDYFASGNDLYLKGAVENDAAVAGDSVDVSGKVGGDLLAAGATIIVSGEVEGDARLAGGQIHISGKFNKNLWVFGGQVTISEDTKVEGSILAAGGVVTIKGNVARNVVVYGGQVDFNGTVHKNVTLSGGTINVGSKVNIDGDLKVSYETQSDIASEAVIQGETSNEKVQNTSNSDFKFFSPSIFGVLNLAAKFISFLSLLLIGLLLAIFFPKVVTKIVNTLDTNPGNSFLIGLFGLPLFVLLVFFLILTILGIPLALILIVLAVVLTYLSNLFVGAYLGQKITTLIFKKEGALIWSMILGLIILELFSILPLVSLITTIFGMGALLIALNNVRQGK